MIALLKADSYDRGGKHGTWAFRVVEGAKRQVLVCCPTCGKVGVLDGHRVDYKGRVTPSVRCPRGGCGFHDNVKLLGWEG